MLFVNGTSTTLPLSTKFKALLLIDSLVPKAQDDILSMAPYIG